MTTRTVYTADVHTVGGREGTAKSSDGQLDIKLSTPGLGRPGTNPEQLFAAGWSACFEGALAYVAKQQGIALPADTAVDASVELHLDDVEGFSISAALDVTIPGIADDVANGLIEAAHQMCPYSKMTRNGIDAVVKLGTRISDVA